MIWWLLLLLLLTAHPALAQTTYYVDPDWTGTKSGTAAQPWTHLSSDADGQWAAINSALASGDVTVYFSARAAGSDTDQTTTSALNILRTNSSTNRLTLDGKSQYNTSDSSPSWSAYSGASRFKITSTYPVSTSNNPPSTQERNRWTLRGFKVVSTNGQCLFMDKVRHVIIEDNDFRHSGTPTEGPCVIIGSSTLNGIAGQDVTIRNNTVANTYGEGIYIGGYYGLSPGVDAGDVLLIEGNTIFDAGKLGGEGDGIDIKDAWTNVTVRNNTIYQQTAGDGEDGIITNSAAIIEDNFVYNFGRVGISLAGFYRDFDGFWTGAIVRRNILVNNGRSTQYSSAAGIKFWDFNGPFFFVTPIITANTVWGTTNDPGQAGSANGIHIEENATTVTLTNNTVAATDGIDLVAVAGTLSTHGNNNFWHSGAGTVAQYGASTYTPATITSFEADSYSVDPLHVDTNTPYLRDNFALQSGSTLCGKSIGAIACKTGGGRFGLPIRR